MNASQFLIVVSLLVLPSSAGFAEEFDPNSLTDLIVVKDAPCEIFAQPYYCALVKKDDKEYLIVLDTGTQDVKFIFLIQGKELSLVWASDVI